jgi:glycosyltransferase involved in cell wall biosynthesis
VKYDWSNLEEKIDYVLSDYNNIRERLVENMRQQYMKKYDLTNLVLHFYNLLSTLDKVVNE